MLNFFKSLKDNPKKQVSAIDAVQELQRIEEILLKKQDYLEKQIEEQLEIIKKNATKNKRVALQALKRRKKLEEQQQKNDGILINISSQKEALEEANSNTQVFKIMQDAGKALQNMHKNIDIDKVEELIDDVKEQQEIAKEISQVISNPKAFGQEYDEDELLKELEELEQNEPNVSLPNISLPEVPTHEIENPSSSKSKHDKELEKAISDLEQWAL